MDPLSQIIALLKPQALAWRIIEAHDAWSIRFPTTDVIVFGQMIEGGCQVALADGATSEFKVGDYLLMAAPSSWTAGTPGGGPPIELKALMGDPRRLLSEKPAPTVTRMFAGAFVLAARDADLFTGLMASVIHIRSAEVAATRLGALLTILSDEALATRPGRSLVLDRLLEIVLVESLRHRSTAFSGVKPGLLAGLEDSRIGAALRVMHSDVRRPWTVGELAVRVGMSRSAFAACFKARVGVSPIDYLRTWRMSLAKSALTSSKTPLSAVADLAGYGSVSAFSTAFSRETGRSPITYARSPSYNRASARDASRSGVGRPEG